ncbi:SAM-dependent methyltransferase [Mycoplasmopsis caviae]|uniref:site-specific DNA-methyltransferase (adenine-specific) n=1 Tax=Mycoplasmopsis caviae TaxID=55603 RepID=A0A3P8KCP8_9BACT|nr:N-6 DNA methylase [Mycoplasmopsis caviae]UUD34844.1 SAM-dependent methyltransferase [Mycoplasmopsis caviae]VDR42304.1 Type IIS restriction enzyme Eco57I [Mycoplasmopsis caviae]
MKINTTYKTKKLGEVFTPQFIVKTMLDELKYDNFDSIYQKHIIDNSAGQGAFLCEVVSRYINISLKCNIKPEKIKNDLETYIHGVEINYDNYLKLIENLNSICVKYNFTDIKWNILNQDSLDVVNYDGQMDYVVGNPPYVRIHNIEKNNKVKNFIFSKRGMTDLYITFFELGFRMLKKDGKLAYISPNSWWNSVAGSEFRKWIIEHRKLRKIYNFGHFQPFKNITTYTCITFFDLSQNYESINYYEYLTGENKKYSYNDILIKGNFYFSNDNTLLQKIIKCKSNKITVKNAFATCNDKVFIKENFNSEISPLIPIIKASRSIMLKCFYPYDKSGKLLPFDSFNEQTKKYLIDNLEKKNDYWYGFGKTQGLKDTFKDKIAINSLIVSNNINSIKLNFLKSGTGVYSGLYILSDLEFEKIEKAIKTQEFLTFIQGLKKYKNGNSWTFNTKDLQCYLNYWFYGKEEN